ncbi:T9SS type A sorting domain-containing protein [Ferruginibacter sp. SUN002]|uniref:T9SS type A sorting domain-containing protein n=1 Tax=Ferruginibacter sp. SUN002 TaxID=2937789 RepID=UPI003D365D04
MKKFFTLFSSGLLLGLVLATNANAQVNDVYFAEGFDGGLLSTLNPSSSTSNPNKYSGAGKNSGDWFVNWTYRTTGTSCANITFAGTPQPNSPMHIRILNPTTSAIPFLDAPTNTIKDTAYIISPVVDFGIGSLSYSSSNARRLIFWTTEDANNTTNPTTPGATGWTKVITVPGLVNLCTDTTIQINKAAAKRVAISISQNSSMDMDSITLRSFLTITPVKFGSINAINANGINKITWTSETEINTKNYIIERSVDGINFTQVGTLAATGATKYVWMDNASLTGKAFYRVKGIDQNGAANFSSIVKTGATAKAQELTVAPNPVKNGQLNLQMANFSKGQYTVNIYNNASQKVFTKVLANDGGTTSQLVQLPSTLKSGVYNLQLLGDAVKMTKRLVVE